MNRLKKAEQLLKKENLAGLIIDKPIDIFYLTGLELSLGRVVITERGATLYVDGRYFEGCKRKAPCPVKLIRKDDKDTLAGDEWTLSGKRVGFDAEYTTYAVFETLSKLSSELIPMSNPLKELKEVKEKGEILALKKAADLGSKGFDFVCSILKEGISEEEVAIELELFWRKKGGQRVAFAPHIAFGEGTAEPHYHAGQRKLKKGDTVLIDIGVVCDHYHSDMTRVLFFGRPSEEIAQVYHIVREAQAEALEICRAGVSIGELDRVARAYIESKGYGKQFLHSLGHGIGLEIHETPTIRSSGRDAQRPLKEGMVITIEPGVYLAGIGGVRLEDTIAITKTGYENLTNREISSSLPIL